MQFVVTPTLATTSFATEQRLREWWWWWWWWWTRLQRTDRSARSSRIESLRRTRISPFIRWPCVGHVTRSPVGHVDLSIRALTSLDACSLTISISSNFSRGFAFVYSFIVPYKEGYIRWNRDGSFRFVEIKSTANMFNSTAHVTPRSIGKSSFSIYRQCKTSNNLIDNFFFLFFQ